MSRPIVTVPRYLAAVRTMHGVGVTEMARALHVTPSVVRRWLRGTLVPTWRRLKGMTALWGGDAELLARADALVERRVGGLGRRRAARRVEGA